MTLYIHVLKRRLYNNRMTMLPVFSYYWLDGVKPIYKIASTFWPNFLPISQLCIHANYPHPHATVSTILLFFLSLLLHDVFSQLALDDNCTITSDAVPPDIRRVPRIGCTAQSCLSCNQAKAECFHNTTSNTFTCTANTSTCSVQVCQPCQYCVGAFISPNTSQNFTLNSLCFNLPQHSTCQRAEAAERCVLNGTISSANDIFTSSVVVVNRDSVHLSCRCYGENCTERLLYTYSILPTSPPTIEQEAFVTIMETGSFQMTPPTSFLVTPTPDIGVGDGKHVYFPVNFPIPQWQVYDYQPMKFCPLIGSQTEPHDQLIIYSRCLNENLTLPHWLHIVTHNHAVISLVHKQ